MLLLQFHFLLSLRNTKLIRNTSKVGNGTVTTVTLSIDTSSKRLLPHVPPAIKQKDSSAAASAAASAAVVGAARPAATKD